MCFQLALHCVQLDYCFIEMYSFGIAIYVCSSLLPYAQKSLVVSSFNFIQDPKVVWLILHPAIFLDAAKPTILKETNSFFLLS